jgi:hypothetical protein
MPPSDPHRSLKSKLPRPQGAFLCPRHGISFFFSFDWEIKSGPRSGP